MASVNGPTSLVVLGSGSERLLSGRLSELFTVCKSLHCKLLQRETLIVQWIERLMHWLCVIGVYSEGNSEFCNVRLQNSNDLNRFFI